MERRGKINLAMFPFPYLIENKLFCNFLSFNDFIVFIAVCPSYVVGVVGIGHIPGIKENWGKVTEDDIPPILR